MSEVSLALGLLLGAVFSPSKLSLSAPPSLAGIAGIAGIYLGHLAYKIDVEYFLS